MEINMFAIIDDIKNNAFNKKYVFFDIYTKDNKTFHYCFSDGFNIFGYRKNKKQRIKESNIENIIGCSIK
jgi:hypothetical protein